MLHLHCCTKSCLASPSSLCTNNSSHDPLHYPHSKLNSALPFSILHLSNRAMHYLLNTLPFYNSLSNLGTASGAGAYFTLHSGSPSRTLYTVHYTLYTVHCTPFTVYCTVYSVQCTVYSVHCTEGAGAGAVNLSAATCELWRGRTCALFDCLIIDSIYCSVKYAVFSVQCLG